MGQSVFGGTGGATGRAASPTTGSVYPIQGAAISGRGAQMPFRGPVGYLLFLVLLEVAALLALRHGFRHHHGG